jgi:hypothetical protein
MDDFFKIVDGIIQRSVKKAPIRVASPNIKSCLALWEAGWKISEYKSIPNSHAINVIFKAGDQEKEIKLNLNELKAWITILEKREELKKNAKSI